MSAFYSGKMSVERTLHILNITKYAYPAILLVLFIVSFVYYGVATAPADGDTVQVHAMKGPGGRPLPTRRKSANQVKAAAEVKDFSSRAKLIFRTLQTGVLATFLINAGVVILQTLIYRKDQWWPGQSMVVRVPTISTFLSLIKLDIHCRFILYLGYHPHFYD